MTALFIFRRDLRIQDNTALFHALRNKTVHCVFFLDPRQTDKKRNPYFGNNSFSFMLESITELQKHIPITVIKAIPHKALPKLIKQLKIKTVYYNLDYTPFSVKRDTAINEAIKKSNCQVKSYHDIALNSPLDIKPYKVFTPYYNMVSKIPVKKSNKITTSMLKNIKNISMKSIDINKLIQYKTNKTQLGGRKYATTILKNYSPKTYIKRRFFTTETSRLSPYLKFGCLSVREVYHAIKNKAYRRQLYWRDFYLQIAYHFPEVFNSSYRYKNIKWSKNKKHFLAWCKGKTGVDIIDASMNQLNTTGYMHNSGRLLVSDYLTKILHIDWRLGEQYFAQKLTDYDPANNNGGWQWSSSTGVSAQPVFRIANPETQAKKYDPKHIYRNKWLKNQLVKKPIVSYKKQREKTTTLYKA